MDVAVKAGALEGIRARRHEVAAAWYVAIAHTSYSPLSKIRISGVLAELVESAVQALQEEPFRPERGRALGTRFADLHFVNPEALKVSQTMLGGEVARALAAEKLAELHPRLLELLTEFGVGFVQRLERQILVNQEQIYGAVMVEYKQALEALQQAKQDLELRIEQRTGELARANEALQRAKADLKDQVAARTAELTASHNRLTMLHELDRSIMTARAPEDVARVVLLNLQQMVPCKLASVGLFDARLQTFSSLVKRDGDEVTVESGKELMLELFAGQIDELQRGHPLVIDDLRAAGARDGLFDKLQERGILSLVNIPMIVQGRLLGSLNIGADARNAFSPEVVESAVEVAISLAATLHNVHLMAALLESEARYRTLVDTSPDAITLSDLDLTIRMANQQAAQLHGFPRPELMVGKNVLEFLVPEDREHARELTVQALELGEIRDIQYSMYRTDGSTFPAELNATLLSDPQGRPQAFLGVIRDVTHRKQIEQALQRRASEMEALYHTSLELNAMVDLQQLLNAVIARATELAGAEMGAVYLVEPDVETLRMVAQHHKPGVRGADISQQVHVGEGLAGRVLQSGESLMVPDYDAWDGRIELPEGNIGRLMGAPLKRGDQVLGVITVFDGEKTGDFAPDEVRLLTMLGAQAAIAIENVNLLDSEREARQTAEILKEAITAVSQSLELDVVLDTLLDYLNRLVPYDSATVMLQNEEEELVVCADRGFEQWAGLSSHGPATFSLDANPILNQVFLDRQTVHIPDVTRQPGWETRPSSQHVRSWMGVPLIVHEKVIGLFSLDKSIPGFFTPAHRTMAEALASQAAVAVHNATLFDAVQTSRRRLQDLSRQLVAVQENERRHLAQELHDEIGQALTGLTLMLASLPAKLFEGSQDQLEAIQSLIGELAEKIDTLSLNLRPTMIDDLGLVPTLIWHTRAYREQTGLQVNLQHTGLDRRFDSEVEIAAYRIVQEALTNAARHAGVDTVEVRLWTDPGCLYVQVEDQGVGFDLMAVRGNRAAIGLEGMQERAEALGGTLNITAAPGAGTALIAALPISDPSERS